MNQEAFDAMSGELAINNAVDRIEGSEDIELPRTYVKLQDAENLRALMVESAKFFISTYERVILSPAEISALSARLARTTAPIDGEQQRTQQNIEAAIRARARKMGEIVATLADLFTDDIDLTKRRRTSPAARRLVRAYAAYTGDEQLQFYLQDETEIG